MNRGYKKKLTLSAVNKAISELHPYIFLQKGNGYYYVASDDYETSMFLAGLFTTSIYVNKLNAYTLEYWIKEVKSILGDNQPANSDNELN